MICDLFTGSPNPPKDPCLGSVRKTYVTEERENDGGLNLLGLAMLANISKTYFYTTQLSQIIKHIVAHCIPTTSAFFLIMSIKSNGSLKNHSEKNF